MSFVLKNSGFGYPEKLKALQTSVHRALSICSAEGGGFEPPVAIVITTSV